MYTVNIREMNDNIITRTFNTLDKAEEYYNQMRDKFVYPELQILADNDEQVDHCFLVGSGKIPMWV